jgi:putative heme-binding domain-containing protein
MAAMNGLLSQESGTLQLLQAAVRQELSVAEIEPTRRELLLKHGNTQIRELAAALFGTTAERPRQAIVAEYRAALDLKGDVAAGQKVFEKTCAACHQLNGIGNSIGPNLASSPSRDASALLNNILDPNQFVLPNYLQYVVIDKSGRTYTGLLSAQSATSITLRKEKAETITILRGDIEELVSSNKSLMPEGLEKELSLQSVADLISWITTVSAKTPDNPNAERDFGTLPGLIETDGIR